MKKSLFTILAFFVLFGIKAQSLELYFEGQLLQDGQEITVPGEASTVFGLDTLDVKNISGAAIDVKCARENIEVVPGTDNSFCWGLCYPPTLDTSAMSITIEPGETCYEFVGDYFPNGNNGTTTVKYSFFDKTNISDIITVIVHYSTNVGIPEPNTNISLTAYPNPANDFVTIDYRMNDLKENSKIIIYDLLGSTVKEVLVNNLSGNLKINVAGLKEGVYFYSFITGNETSNAHKLLIKH